MESFLDRCTAKKNTLTQSEDKIIFQLKQHEKPFLLSMNELAMLSEVSEPSVVRLYKKLGYKSYQELKVALAQEQAEFRTPSQSDLDILPDDSVDVIFEKFGSQFFQAVSLTKENLPLEQLDVAIEKLKDAKGIYFFGQGLSGTMAEDGAHKFLRLGGMVMAVKDPHYQAIYATHMTNKDVVIAISHSGETIDTINVCEIAKDNNAYVIVITSSKHATLAKLADMVLVTHAQETMKQPGAYVSRLIQLSLMDTLFTKVAAESDLVVKENISRSHLAVTRMKK
ncbi:MurR/RpiR family transcriptional regulator [Sutcliffiella rhizosphaerae]|uniref:HTH-type transcriptional regulator YbbH n=1 Tax=Sutcliffiella rhizosphaerae TaxID=2880967 RepID=A0ABM8YRV2_9BACI|nr:MurR/RpiR family transcriptional regulator [Sutcliffiella rhizosphaerae]CAG9622725.1 putative HTH-type transcriptional regulator YbbH [Sutcliffiella rhizosphaerae]